MTAKVEITPSKLSPGARPQRLNRVRYRVGQAEEIPSWPASGAPHIRASGFKVSMVMAVCPELDPVLLIRRQRWRH